MDLVMMINKIYNIEIKIIPVITLYLIWLLSTKIREQFKIKYTPVYCSLPVFKNSKKLQEFYMGAINERDKNIRKVKKDCMISYVIDSTIIPIILGIIFGFFNVQKNIFYPALVLIILKRVTQFIKCFIEIEKEQLLKNKDKIRLIIFYSAFIVLFVKCINNAYILTSTDRSLSISYYMGEIKDILVNYLFAWIGIPRDILSISEPVDELEIATTDVCEE